MSVASSSSSQDCVVILFWMDLLSQSMGFEPTKNFRVQAYDSLNGDRMIAFKATEPSKAFKRDIRCSDVHQFQGRWRWYQIEVPKGRANFAWPWPELKCFAEVMFFVEEKAILLSFLFGCHRVKDAIVFVTLSMYFILVQISRYLYVNSWW